MAIGNVFGILIMLAVPGQDEIGVDLYLLGQLVAPLATSIGIWLVGTVGRETGSIKYPLIATYVAVVFFINGVFTYGVVTLIGNANTLKCTDQAFKNLQSSFKALLLSTGNPKNG
jgi:hypothetical protein